MDPLNGGSIIRVAGGCHPRETVETHRLLTTRSDLSNGANPDRPIPSGRSGRVASTWGPSGVLPRPAQSRINGHGTRHCGGTPDGPDPLATWQRSMPGSHLSSRQTPSVNRFGLRNQPVNQEVVRTRGMSLRWPFCLSPEWRDGPSTGNRMPLPARQFSP